MAMRFEEMNIELRTEERRRKGRRRKARKRGRDLSIYLMHWRLIPNGMAFDIPILKDTKK
jgi:hypothetical protein